MPHVTSDERLDDKSYKDEQTDRELLATSAINAGISCIIVEYYLWLHAESDCDQDCEGLRLGAGIYLILALSRSSKELEPRT